jgi:orotidine-5'-phosphate decarboxylase
LKAVPEYGIILAVDSRARDEVLGLVAAVGPMVDGIKLGVPTLLANGSSIVGSVKDVYDGPLIADLKVADIGFREKGEGAQWSGTNKAIVETAVAAGIDYVICHTIVGTSSIEECVAAAHSLGGKVLTLPFMTHKGAGLFFDLPLDQDHAARWLVDLGLDRVKDRIAVLAERKRLEGGWRAERVTVSDLVIMLGEELGVDGYIGPANRVEVLREYRKLTARLVMATGVGRQGGTLSGVYSALGRNSAAILGHSIYGVADPAGACEEFLKERDAMVSGN